MKKVTKTFTKIPPPQPLSAKKAPTKIPSAKKPVVKKAGGASAAVVSKKKTFTPGKKAPKQATETVATPADPVKASPVTVDIEIDSDNDEAPTTEQ